MPSEKLLETIRLNCDISDARDAGNFSLCTLFLRLRNIYKWENGLEPWQEPDSPVLLDWIENRESTWEALLSHTITSLPLQHNQLCDPFNVEAVNQELASEKIIYGAGYGHNMKAIFFLADLHEERTLHGYRVIVTGKEWIRELASPFAMTQDSVIIFRRVPFRFFLWDRIQETGAQPHSGIAHALKEYGIMDDGVSLNRDRLARGLDGLIDGEIEPIIHHELGEILEDRGIDLETLERVTVHLHGSAAEIFVRAVNDVLADTHPEGMLGYIVNTKRSASLGIFATLLDGMRKALAPELTNAACRFFIDYDWESMDEARRTCRARLLDVAAQVRTICHDLSQKNASSAAEIFDSELLSPLGLGKKTA